MKASQSVFGSVCVLMSILVLPACGSNSNPSELSGFDSITFTPNDSDRFRRIGYDSDGNKYVYGGVEGNEYVLPYVPNRWLPLVSVAKIRGGQVMSVPVLSMGVSYVPMWGSDFRNWNEHWSTSDWECWANGGQNHEGSFKLRTRYKVNGKETTFETPAIPIVHQHAPKYPDNMQEGVIMLPGLYTDGSVTDLFIEIGYGVDRAFTGRCNSTEVDEFGKMEKRDISRSIFDVRFTKIVVPHAENK